MGTKRDMIRGALLGLAVGDAMGYTVDGRNLEEIQRDYGPNGLLGYDLVNGYADITSYTQLAAFTANGLLMGLTRERMQGQKAPLSKFAAVAIREWSRSQHFCKPERNYCWLSAMPTIKRRRCMDTRMLDVLERGSFGTIEQPTLRSNHPGALTTAVPVALLQDELKMTPEETDRLGAQIVALTHGDPEAFLSGAVLTHGLSALLKAPGSSVEELLRDTVSAVQLQFGREFAQTTKIWELLQMAITLASSDWISQAEAMERLSCRTAAEVLAGALYACMTCHGDFDAAMITAVNHSGRSAAVGAITGAILGIRQGQSALPEFYLESLEPVDILLELADDITMGCPMGGSSFLFDDDWDRKYLHAGA